MKTEKLTQHPDAKQLILCFAGWSASPELFRRLTADDNQDVWVCYDYRDISLTESLESYNRIYLIAWSLGVWVAEQLLAETIRKTSQTIQRITVAINGTGAPIDDQFGIPEVIFKGTLEHLDETGRQHFNRRMCGNKEHFAAYKQLPERPLPEIQEELQQLFIHIKEDAHPAASFPWTKVWLSRQDRIFPIDNLRNYWKDRAAICETDSPHEPFYISNKWEELWK